MVFFQRLKTLVQLFVPWIENEDLKTEGRGCDEKIRDGDCPRDEHLDKFRNDSDTIVPVSEFFGVT